ncbi:MAG: hypoxanthine-guanine phosphoribosyltransferase [gamma proteobacterium symbiont of Taylorina sp.]|nr:hypoxanthine-guanine phosphoribosyltransferase [gamma proteobacterium symbiont of Taylorina sp.]
MSDTKQLFLESQEVKEKADCLFNKNEVYSAIVSLAEEISIKLSDTNPVVVGIMNGGLIPLGLLLPELDFPLQVDYLHATRYRDKTRGGQLQWLVSPRTDFSERTILLVDDIHDEGITLNEIKTFCHNKGAKNVYSAVLVNKLHDRKNDTCADFIGLEVPDRYVFGFGMDYKGMLRNVPGIYAVKGM